MHSQDFAKLNEFAESAWICRNPEAAEQIRSVRKDLLAKVENKPKFGTYNRFFPPKICIFNITDFSSYISSMQFFLISSYYFFIIFHLFIFIYSFSVQYIAATDCAEEGEAGITSAVKTCITSPQYAYWKAFLRKAFLFCILGAATFTYVVFFLFWVDGGMKYLPLSALKSCSMKILVVISDEAKDHCC